jgi:hypothetical protein
VSKIKLTEKYSQKSLKKIEYYQLLENKLQKVNYPLKILYGLYILYYGHYPILMIYEIWSIGFSESFEIGFGTWLQLTTHLNFLLGFTFLMTILTLSQKGFQT